MVRHLKRLSDGIHDALQSEALDRASLTLLQPYQPNLAVTWLFQRAMSVGMNQTIAPNQINQLLSAVFTEMSQLGDPVLKPFLQDVVQWSPLSQTLVKTSLAHPDLVLKILPQVGVPTLLNWLLHYTNLAGYTALALLAQRVSSGTESVPSKPQYAIRRWLEALEYGSGGDYSD